MSQSELELSAMPASALLSHDSETKQDIAKVQQLRAAVQQLGTSIPASPLLADLYEDTHAYDLLVNVGAVAQENIEVGLYEREQPNGVHSVVQLSVYYEEARPQLLHERPKGLQRREIALPSQVDNAAVQVSLQSGLLSLHLPKLAPSS